ncbi:MAG: response regulator [Desulfobacterales bacterium]
MPEAAKKILVVDDDRVILAFAERLLSSQGHEVKTAGDGFEALNILSAYTPDVIFFDLIMPKIDGDKLIQIVRSMPRLEKSFLVIVSAAVAETDFNFSETGADYYVAKGPFSAMAENLLAAVRAADSPHPVAPQTPVIGLEHVYSRQLTRELLSRNRHLETILESMSEGILEVYAGKVVYANTAAVQMLGIPVRRMLTACPTELFPEAVRGEVEALFRTPSNEPAETEPGRPLEVHGRELVVKKLPVKGDEETAIWMILDVTERRRLESQIQHIQKMEALGTIAAGVAHNFRNTLTEILVNSQLIQLNHKDRPELQEIAARIHSSVKRGARLVDGLLHFSRKEIRREFQPLDIVPVIREALAVVEGSFDPRIRIEARVPDALWVVGDATGLSQVFMNLFTNARDAMPAGGVLRVEAGEEGDSVLIVVSDTGCGMDAETLEKCFDPFFTTKPVGQGTGLGLSTAYGIIKSHDGRIHIESRPGGGTVFHIRLPRAAASKTAEKTKAEDYTRGRGETVLFVDDENEILRAMEGLLRTLNYRPLCTASAEEAVRLYRSLKPDLVLLDVNMPGMGGIECGKRILEVDPEARIVLFTGCEPGLQDDGGEEGRAISRGTLTKPADLKELSGVLAAVLRSGHAKRSIPSPACLKTASGEIEAGEGRSLAGSRTGRPAPREVS